MAFYEKKMRLSIVDGDNPITGSSVIISKGRTAGFLRFRIALKLDAEYRITGITKQEKGGRCFEKDVASAAVGRIMTCGIGVLAASAIGGKKKNTSTVLISFIDDGIDKSLFVQCDQKQYAELSALL